jgi:tRNA modification GTPase
MVQKRNEFMSHPTIFAQATGRGAAAIAVIRLSGPDTALALAALGAHPLPSPRVATRVRLRAPGTGVVLDDALVLWFPGPASFTGEDSAELSIHGGRAVIEAVAAALGGIESLRPAEPGEFTRRAFENGKLDLTQVEAVADLVAAETEAQRVQALDQLGGGLGTRFEGWRARLTAIIAEVEAAVDFADEEIPADLLAGIKPKILGLIDSFTQYIGTGDRGERLRDGLRVVILGAPNVGKSSLLNAIAGRDAAMVSTTAGTTRDVIEVRLDLGGLPVILSDTAGLRDSADALEAEGVRRARDRAGSADLRLVVFDASAPGPDATTAALLGPGCLAVLNKSDLVLGDKTAFVPVSASGAAVPAVAVSARDGSGLKTLLDRIEAVLADRLGQVGPAPLTRARHRAALVEARDSLRRALETDAAEAPEIMAEELRAAASALGRVTGRVDVEDVLGQIFSEFCIGK